MNTRALKTVFRDTIPVLTGYLFLGIGFGILLSEQGYGIGWAFFMALFIFAGSAQYLAVSLLASHASLITTAIATLLVNARHLFYGISVLDLYKDAGKAKPYLIFGLSDETYSLVTQNQPPEGISRHGYCFLVTLLDHIYWICGCVLGSVVGPVLPIGLEGVEFVLTAMFVTMFVEQWLTQKDHRPAVIGLLSTALCLLIFAKDIFLIPSLALIAALLTISGKTGRRQDNA